MRKLFLPAWIICFLLMSSNFCRAQFRLNPHLSVQLGDLDVELPNEEATEIEALDGWNFNAFFRYQFGDWFLYSGLGYQGLAAEIERFELQGGNTIVEFEEDTRFHFLKVPVNIGYYLAPPSAFLRPYARTGIQNDFLVGLNVLDDFTLNREDGNTYQLGVNIGAGVDFALFNLDLQYQWGITEFFPDTDEALRSFNISLGLVL